MAQYLGQVIGTKMDKTVKVCVTSLRLHPVILKYWNHKKVYFAHDDQNQCNEGDYVLIKEGRKLSKRKWFRVIDIVEKAPQLTDNDSFDVTAKEDVNSFKTIADKAKKETKILNKKARKALATEDGGDLRFQDNWAVMHQKSTENVKKTKDVECHVDVFTKQWLQSNEYLLEFHGNLMMLPDVIAKVEIAEKRIDAIWEQTRKIEELILEYEDLCERSLFEKQKSELKLKLSQLVETKSAEYTFKKNMLNGKTSSISPNTTPTKLRAVNQNLDDLVKKETQEKHKAYEAAFYDQMDQYIRYGELEKPIAGSVDVTSSSAVDDITIEDSDWSTLSEFLGPEDLDSVMKAHNAVNAKKTLSTDNLENDEIDNKQDSKSQEENIESTPEPFSGSDDSSVETILVHTTAGGGAIENSIALSNKEFKQPEESDGDGDDDEAEFFDADSKI